MVEEACLSFEVVSPPLVVVGQTSYVLVVVEVGDLVESHQLDGGAGPPFVESRGFALKYSSATIINVHQRDLSH